MLLYFSSGLDGDAKVDFEVIDKDPYFKIVPPAKIADGADMVDQLTKYVSAVSAFATDTLPGMKTESEELAERVQSVIDGAADEISGLSGMDKVKAPIKAGKNASLLKDLVKDIKEKGEEITQELKDLKSGMQEAKETSEGEKFKEACKKLKEKP